MALPSFSLRPRAADVGGAHFNHLIAASLRSYVFCFSQSCLLFSLTFPWFLTMTSRKQKIRERDSRTRGGGGG